MCAAFPHLLPRTHLHERNRLPGTRWGHKFAGLTGTQRDQAARKPVLQRPFPSRNGVRFRPAKFLCTRLRIWGSEVRILPGAPFPTMSSPETWVTERTGPNGGTGNVPRSRRQLDPTFLEYFNTRKVLGWVIHRFFGDPGLRVVTARYVAPEHQSAIAVLRERLTDPGFASALKPLERAELDLLAAAPLDFISCTARRGRGQAAG